ncbi:Tad domain-containing protein [Actinomarinicola tropica]|uniref:Putative Flp pilus-assembly TadG-like N-terminal domain-containing protein n=1 Tax=Actinomarinicola tropica TaxID=2789776 RepID=A0A5Q2RKF9_9ACTN|nr:Tad domain-containing protein [Actinomarinicola tropica]QGG95061.1 hypothetical protein GH723_08045 [Actinomarinicola tropica]
MTRRERLRRDDGVVLAVAAILLVALMGMAAFAVDLGGLYNARRQDQSAADVAALAGVRELPVQSSAADEVIRYAEDTLGVASGEIDWNSCGTDPGALSQRIPGSNCLSVDPSGAQLRVRIPDQTYETFFAHIVGVEDFTHSAFAIAALDNPGFGGVLPFGIPSLGGGGGYICPATPPGGLATDPCSGPDSGNFGYLNLAHYRTADCNQGGGSNRFGQNLAMGADHQIAPWDGADRREFALCPTITEAGPPNVMRTETGNIANRVAQGMITGPGNPAGAYPDGELGRLARLSPLLFDGSAAPAAARTTTMGSITVDDNPLWNFIPASLGGDVPASCQRTVFVDGAGNPRDDVSGVVPNFADPADRSTFIGLLQTALAGRSGPEVMIALLDRCFTHYLGQEWGADYGISQGEPSPCAPTGCTGPVFAVNSTTDEGPDLWDIQYTSRFGYVPEFQPGCDPNGSAECRIDRFRAIFIQQTCGGSGSGNCSAFDPGFGQTRSSAPGSITGVTMWAFPDSMLPGALGGPNAPNEVGVNRFVELIR